MSIPSLPRLGKLFLRLLRPPNRDLLRLTSSVWFRLIPRLRLLYRRRGGRKRRRSWQKKRTNLLSLKTRLLRRTFWEVWGCLLPPPDTHARVQKLCRDSVSFSSEKCFSEPLWLLSEPLLIWFPVYVSGYGFNESDGPSYD